MNAFESRLAEALALAVDAEATEEAYWEAIRALHDLGDEAAYAALAALLSDPDPDRAGVAVNGLRYFAHGAEPWRSRTRALYLAVLGGEPGSDLVHLIGCAAPEVDDAWEIAERLLPLRGHPDALVRSGVVSAILGWGDPRALDALMALSADPDDWTRDWATFGLAQATGDDDGPVDAPEIRAALRARLADPLSEVRAEAALGLALRGDRSLLGAVEAELAGDGPEWGQWVEAAGALADPCLLPALERLLERGWGEVGGQGTLREAIAALRSVRAG